MKTKSKNFKKRIAILSILCMVISLMPAGSFGLETSDISEHWAKENIQNWIEGGLVNGYKDGTFRPDSNISRAEFMTLVNKAYNYSNEAEIGFLDVKISDWYFSAVAKAKAAGYISGYPDNKIRPEFPITRAEAAAIIMRINKVEGNLVEASKFKDALKFGWGAEAIGSVYKHKIMNGYLDGSFMAQSFIKRGETIVALDKAIAYAKVNTTYELSGTYGPASGILQVEGNVIVTKQDTTLQNMVINGDLTIRKSVGEGDVALNNIIVKGETLVCGGGPNSIRAYNSKFGTVTIAKEVGNIRFLITGTTTVEMVIADSSIKLEEENMVGANVGFIEVHFEGQPHDTLILIGCFGDVDVNNPNMNVEMPNGTTVNSMCLNQRTDVTGEGVVALANIFVDGSTFEFSPETFDIAVGVGEPVSKNPTTEVVVPPGVETHHHSGNDSNEPSVEVSPITAANVTILAGSIIFGYIFTGDESAITYTQAKEEPYYLNEDESTVTIGNSTMSSSPVLLKDLGISEIDGTISYSNLAALQTQFSGLNFSPTQIAIHLVGGSLVNAGANEWTKDVLVSLSSTEIGLLRPPTIYQFNFTKANNSQFIGTASGVIDETNKTIIVNVPFGTNVTALKPSLYKSPSNAVVSPASLVACDFSFPASYTVTAIDGTTQVYTVTVNISLETDKIITNFYINSPRAIGVIDETNKTISVQVPYGTQFTDEYGGLLQAFVSFKGKSVVPASLKAFVDYSNPVTYTVTASDNTTQIYTVTVTTAAIN